MIVPCETDLEIKQKVTKFFMGVDGCLCWCTMRKVGLNFLHLERRHVLAPTELFGKQFQKRRTIFKDYTVWFILLFKVIQSKCEQCVQSALGE